MVGISRPTLSLGDVGGAPTVEEDALNEIYKQNDQTQHNWYKQKPYGFVFTDREGTRSTFYLPIAPSNINIITHFATNVLATMYGTVEEHSEQRYYDITISGTTGMSPRYFNTVSGQVSADESTIGRAGYPVGSLIDTGGFARRTQALVDAALNNAADLFGGERGTTGIDLEKTGYVAFHNFYRWLLLYKKDTSGEVSGDAVRGGHPLQFVNYKDNNMYDVAIQNFQLTRSADNPMLYNYNIVLRAYNLRSPDDSGNVKDVLDRKASLGLDGLQTSLFATMANKARQAKNAAYAVIAAAKGFGS
jgi:hypothetical protein